MGRPQELPLRVRVDLDVMAIKEYHTLFIAQGLTTHKQMQFSVIQDIRWWEVWSLIKDAVGVFYSHNQLSCVCFGEGV